ncbi:MAG: hypothetical protein VXX30_00520 [Planctomycetota bacterium]|nr:hypothetical protein [Planctomycetota bacterium]
MIAPTCPPTTGACCLGGTCVTTTQSDCETAGGTYAGDDVACTDAECATSCPADTNRDGSVDGQDLAAVLANWGLPCEEWPDRVDSTEPNPLHHHPVRTHGVVSCSPGH